MYIFSYRKEITKANTFIVMRGRSNELYGGWKEPHEIVIKPLKAAYEFKIKTLKPQK